MLSGQVQCNNHKLYLYFLMDGEIMKKQREWIKGFLGFLGFLGINAFKTGDYSWMLWFFWFTWFYYFKYLFKK